MLTSEELQAARDIAMRNKAILDAQLEAVREHRWEHKAAPIGATLGGYVSQAQSSGSERKFSRSEVLTVLRAEGARRDSMEVATPRSVIGTLIAIFERME